MARDRVDAALLLPLRDRDRLPAPARTLLLLLVLLSLLESAARAHGGVWVGRGPSGFPLHPRAVHRRLPGRQPLRALGLTAPPGPRAARGLRRRRLTSPSGRRTELPPGGVRLPDRLCGIGDLL